LICNAILILANNVDTYACIKIVDIKKKINLALFCNLGYNTLRNMIVVYDNYMPISFFDILLRYY